MRREREVRPVWVVSELYYPEETSTGYLLAKIAEGLATGRPVRVVCGQPSYAARGTRAHWEELHNGVAIQRCCATTWNKDILPLRLVNVLTISLSVVFRLLRVLHQGDQVIVVTNPPLLPFFVSWACRARGARCFLLIHDVYPEVLAAAGLLSSNSWFSLILQHAVRRLYRSAERIIVLGRDMRELVQRKLPPAERDKVIIIRNWADVDLVRPQPREENSLLRKLGLSDKFVVQYAGNLGRSHNVEGILECAERLQHEPDIHLLVIGSGAKRPWLEQASRQKNLANITILDHRPRCEQPDFLNACDVSIITFVAGMAGISVPSRMYNVLAAGRPIIAVADPHSELALCINEEEVGWVVSPGDVDAFAWTILEARDCRGKLREMGERARSVAEKKYRLDGVTRAYEQLFDESIGRTDEFDALRRDAAQSKSRPFRPCGSSGASQAACSPRGCRS